MFRILFLTVICALSSLVKAQGVGIQFYQGVSKPMVSYKSGGNSLVYQSAFGSDTRLGIGVGDSNKISFALLLGANTVNSVYTSNNIISSFSHSSLLVDVPFRYSLKESPISSVSVGPSLGLLVASSQNTNGLPVRSESVFTPINYSLLTEIAISGYSTENLKIYPYVSYRIMLNSADNDGDNLKLNCLSFGLRIDIQK